MGSDVRGARGAAGYYEDVSRLLTLGNRTGVAAVHRVGRAGVRDVTMGGDLGI
jgi:hypothetical protein